MITTSEEDFNRILEEVKEHFHKNYARIREYNVRISIDEDRIPTVNFGYEVIPNYIGNGGD